MSGFDWIASRPIAHRGLHGQGTGAVENSLIAAEAALEAGFGIEIDVQAAADQEPVVFHDAALERLTDEVGSVAALTSRQLSGIRLRNTSERIPTLQALLDLIAGRTPLFVEVKTDWTGMPAFCARIAGILGAYAGPVAVMSFDPRTVETFRKIAPQLPRGIISEAFRDWHPPLTTAGQRLSLRHLLHAGRTRPHFINYHVDDLPSAAPFLGKAFFGLPLLAWTVVTEEQRQRAGRWASQIVFEGFRP